MNLEVDKMYQQSKNRPRCYNLSKVFLSERCALGNVNNDDLIIKNADKGGAAVVWGKDKFIEEANRQFNDPD